MAKPKPRPRVAPCAYCNEPAIYAIATTNAKGRVDNRNACEEHEMQARLEALKGKPAPLKESTDK